MEVNKSSIESLVGYALQSIGRKSSSQGVTQLSSAPMVSLVEKMVDEAVRLGASDIHIEPVEKSIRVRYRLDGILREVYDRFPIKISEALIARIKIAARLNSTESRVPQDGRFTHIYDGTPVDVRVSTMPVIEGETVVLRLLSGSKNMRRIDELDFSEENYPIFREWCRRPSGLLLSTGPVGSGKTTTLYAAISEINSPELNVITIEDPVEYNIPGVNQIQVNNGVGLTFAKGLRSILRQDPDVCMVGEIRDDETAEIAVRAALTGRLIFSTLHTGSAPGAIFRLMEMGVKPYFLAASLIGIAAQRLVRRLCPSCRSPYEVESPDEKKALGAWYRPGMTLFRANGCEKCYGTGYAGRMAIHEVMPINDDMRGALLTVRDISEIGRIARSEGMTPLIDDGIAKAIAGHTTLSEVRRMVYGTF